MGKLCEESMQHSYSLYFRRGMVPSGVRVIPRFPDVTQVIDVNAAKIGVDKAKVDVGTAKVDSGTAKNHYWRSIDPTEIQALNEEIQDADDEDNGPRYKRAKLK
jgi:hypothetical protein